MISIYALYIPRSGILTLVFPLFSYRYSCCINPRLGILNYSFDTTCWFAIFIQVSIKWPHGLTIPRGIVSSAASGNASICAKSDT